MQLSKHMIGLSVVALATLGYFVIQNNTSSISDGVKVNTGSVTPVSQSDTGVEADTGKRLEIVANSGTQWGISPFGSGKPLTEEKKPEFKKPNTEWKSRSVTLSDGRALYYEFGKGNPAGVALSKDQIIAMNKTCEGNASLMEKGICNAESGLLSYVTPEVENHILLALSDPNWSKLATVCEKNFRTMENSDILANANNYPEYPTFDRVFSPGWLDVEKYLSIDSNTGLKLLNLNRIYGLATFLTQASHYGSRKDDGWINPSGDCVDQHATEIVRNLYSAYDLYKNPLEYADGYTNQFILSKKFHLSQF